MRSIDTRLRLFLRFVILAIVVSTLAPAMSSATRQAAAGAGVFAELCSASGMRMLAVDGGDAVKQPPGDGGMAAHGGDCQFCSSSVEPLTPSLPAPSLVLIHVGLAYLAPLFTAAPRTLFIWAARQARAPPATLIG